VPAESPPGLTLVPLSDVEARSIVFLDKPLWQKTGFHLLTGRKGVGKGTELASLASRISRGELGEKANVIWISSEDSAAIDIKPRVLAAGGDPERIYIVQEWIQLPRDLDLIREAITETGDVGLVTLDPVGNHIAGKNSNAETEIRDAIAPLNHLSDELETLLIGVRHLSEKECSRGVLAAILGSSAWVQVPRAVIAIVRDNEDASISHVQCVAGNRLPPGTPGRMFRIEGVILPGLENEVTRAVLLGDSTQDVEAMLSAGGDKGPSKSEKAREVLLDALRKGGGEMESDLLDATVAEATGLKATTVRNLRVELKDKGWLRPVPEKDETGAVLRWMVKLTNAAPAADPDHLARANTTSRDLDYLSQSRDPDHHITGTRESRDLDEPRACASESPLSGHLIDERGRCTRHPDEPKPWCLECKASARS
jgi:putative DNA primase/helicase